MFDVILNLVRKSPVLLHRKLQSPLGEPRNQKIANVEAGRGISATLVVLFHTTNYYFSSQKYWSESAWDGFFKFGHAGVEFFFVLSGYIMLSVHYQDIGKREKTIPFLKKRFLRVYPLFWLVFIISLVAVKMMPQASGAEYGDLPRVIQSVLLAGEDPTHSVVFVSWSLWHEILFYSMFAIVIGYPKVGVPLMVIWASVCLLDRPLKESLAVPSYTIDIINILFLFGLFASLVLRKASVPAPRLVLLTGLAAFLGTGLYDNLTPNVEAQDLRVFYGIGSALALLGAVEIERQQGIAAPRWLVVLGNASYSIYLTHILWLTILAKLASSVSLPKMVPAWIAFPALTLLTVLGGVFVHFLIEAPLIRSLQIIRVGRAA